MCVLFRQTHEASYNSRSTVCIVPRQLQGRTSSQIPWVLRTFRGCGHWPAEMICRRLDFVFCRILQMFARMQVHGAQSEHDLYKLICLIVKGSKLMQAVCFYCLLLCLHILDLKCREDNPYMAILTFLIGYNNLIPISLYMTTDLVRTLQAFIMESDESMYHKNTDAHCKVRSSGLCEDLGQVDFVLSDKTGTLTQNEMCYKACWVDGQTYGYWTECPDDSNDADDASVNHEMMGCPTEHIERLPPRSICLPLGALGFWDDLG